MEMTNAGTRTRWLLPGVILLLAPLQLALLPAVAGGQSLTLYALFALDSLSLTLGVAWTLALGLVLISGIAQDDPPDPRGSAPAWETIFVSVGLLLVAYSGNGVTLSVGLACAGTGAWRALKRNGNNGEAAMLLRNLLIAAALLLAATALSGLRTFVPPTGGVTEPWEPLVSIATVVAVLLMARCWPFYYSRGHGSGAGKGNIRLGALLSLAAPVALAKMLIAAPIQPVGMWATILLGMLALLGGAYASSLEDGTARHAAPTLAGIAVTGFGLASASPGAAAGAVWVMLAGLLLVVVGEAEVRSGTMRGGCAFIPLASLPGVWLISQGALDTGYGVVATLLLPAYAFVLLLSLRWIEGKIERATSGRVFAAAVALTIITAAIALAYPQALIEWILRPVVGSMAGGVGTLQVAAGPWGVGLLLQSAQETILAALPATGAAVGVFLAWVALSWLKQGLVRVIRRTQDGKAR